MTSPVLQTKYVFTITARIGEVTTVGDLPDLDGMIQSALPRRMQRGGGKRHP